MIEIRIPGRGEYHLEHVVLDTNGTVALDGRLTDGVASRLSALRDYAHVHLLTADTFGTVADIERELGFPAVRIRSSADKAAYVERLGKTSVAAIGNGANDAGMLSAAALGIAVIGLEGLAREALEAADVVVPSVLAAIDILLRSKRLVATLRT